MSNQLKTMLLLGLLTTGLVAISIHPPAEERIGRLMAISSEMPRPYRDSTPEPRAARMWLASTRSG